MIDLQADLAVFYGPDFARPFVRVAGGVAQPAFLGIVSEPDATALDGYTIGTSLQLGYPASVGLVDGDHVRDISGPVPIAYTVRDPRATADGLQATARLEQRA